MGSVHARWDLWVTEVILYSLIFHTFPKHCLKKIFHWMILDLISFISKNDSLLLLYVNVIGNFSHNVKNCVLLEPNFVLPRYYKLVLTNVIPCEKQRRNVKLKILLCAVKGTLLSKCTWIEHNKTTQENVSNCIPNFYSTPYLYLWTIPTKFRWFNFLSVYTFYENETSSILQ